LQKEPLGTGKDGKDIYLKEIWPSASEIQQTIGEAVGSEMFRSSYENVFAGDERWKGMEVALVDRFSWDASSTYVRRPPYFEGMTMQPRDVPQIQGARALVLLGDSITTDHISPAGAIAPDSPAGVYLQERQVSPNEFNSYGSRRGNHEVMMRGTFANVRLRNRLAPGTEGGWRLGVRHGLITRLGREGSDAARRSRGDRQEFRAHPSLEPGWHGSAAADVRRR
jgi:aconitate hydratase